MEKPEWKHPFGEGYQNRNMVEKYLREIFASVDDEDVDGLKELFEELSIEQHLFLNNLLASYTRSNIKRMLHDD